MIDCSEPLKEAEMVRAVVIVVGILAVIGLLVVGGCFKLIF
jgi:hypothetical protein